MCLVKVYTVYTVHTALLPIFPGVPHNFYLPQVTYWTQGRDDLNFVRYPLKCLMSLFEGATWPTVSIITLPIAMFAQQILKICCDSALSTSRFHWQRTPPCFDGGNKWSAVPWQSSPFLRFTWKMSVKIEVKSYQVDSVVWQEYSVQTNSFGLALQ